MRQKPKRETKQTLLHIYGSVFFCRKIRLEKELKNLSYQVRKIGVNINQVVAKINAGYGNQIDIYNLEKALEQVKHEMKTLNEKVEDYGNH